MQIDRAARRRQIYREAVFKLLHFSQNKSIEMRSRRQRRNLSTCLRVWCVPNASMMEGQGRGQLAVNAVWSPESACGCCIVQTFTHLSVAFSPLTDSKSFHWFEMCLKREQLSKTNQALNVHTLCLDCIPTSPLGSGHLRHEELQHAVCLMTPCKREEEWTNKHRP